jgi:hypothetical protein
MSNAIADDIDIFDDIAYGCWVRSLEFKLRVIHFIDNCVCVTLAADSILATGIEKPHRILGAHFCEQRTGVDAGTDEPNVLH